MTTHKTFSGMIQAVERLTANLESGTTRIDDQREYDATNRKIKALLAELNALWTNPADVTTAAKAKNRLLEAWHHATV